MLEQWRRAASCFQIQDQPRFAGRPAPLLPTTQFPTEFASALTVRAGRLLLSFQLATGDAVAHAVLQVSSSQLPPASARYSRAGVHLRVVALVASPSLAWHQARSAEVLDPEQSRQHFACSA